MSNPRLRRLQSDYEKIQEEFTNHPKIEVQAFGNPPERYIVTYRIKGIECLDNGNPVYSDEHNVEIYLPSGYPGEPVQCEHQTPIFHPNFSGATPGIICIGDDWSPAEGLADLIVRIGEMIQYKSCNPESPLNGIAAAWSVDNENMLPVDNSELSTPKPEIVLSDAEDDSLDITLYDAEPEVDVVLYPEEEAQPDEEELPDISLEELESPS